MECLGEYTITRRQEKPSTPETPESPEKPSLDEAPSTVETTRDDKRIHQRNEFENSVEIMKTRKKSLENEIKQDETEIKQLTESKQDIRCFERSS